MKPFLVLFTLFTLLVSCTARDSAGPQPDPSLEFPGAGITERIWTDQSRNRTLKAALWYPTREAPETVRYLAFRGYAKAEAAIPPGRYPLIIISHGTGSHRYAQFYMAEFLAARGYMVLSVEPPFDNAFDDKDTRTAANLWNRPGDISVALDRLVADEQLGAFVDQDRIGMIGHSVGGYTAVAVAGAVPDPARLDAYCEQYPEDRYMCCKAESQKTSPFRYKDMTTLWDKRIKAIFLMAPALGQAFGDGAMDRVTIPVCLIASGRDEVLPEPHNIGQYLKVLPRQPEFHEFPEAGHFAYLPVCPLVVKVVAMQACTDAGTPRQEIHPLVNRMSLDFFNRNL